MPIALAEFVMRPQAEESNRRELTIYLIMFMLSRYFFGKHHLVSSCFDA
jgi:hypothetical protein